MDWLVTLPDTASLFLRKIKLDFLEEFDCFVNVRLEDAVVFDKFYSLPVLSNKILNVWR